MFIKGDTNISVVPPAELDGVCEVKMLLFEGVLLVTFVSGSPMLWSVLKVGIEGAK